MASTPFISHTVNGYSRYDIPESVAFSATPGIIYPVRVDFMNARDVRYIQNGAVIRTNPALLPTFTPFRVSLHRFFVPMQLYHPEMRVNSSKFDFQTLSTNVIPAGIYTAPGGSAASVNPVWDGVEYLNGRSLLSFAGLYSGRRPIAQTSADVPDDPFLDSMSSPSLGDRQIGSLYVNADPILAYYDIIRSYYSFSQVGTISFAFPASSPEVGNGMSLPSPGSAVIASDAFLDYTQVSRTSNVIVGSAGEYWRQAIGSLAPLDTLYESTFYPKRGEDRGLYYDRMPYLCQAILESISSTALSRSDDSISVVWNRLYEKLVFPSLSSTTSLAIPLKFMWSSLLPFGVAPAVADRFSRLLPLGDTDDVSLTNISTVRGLAFAAKLQAYKDLLSSGGNRFTDWLMTFFAAKVSHVDRPVLVYSSSFYMNSSPIFSQQGGETLGTYAGVIEGNSSFGKKAQRYCFDEPGYLMDMFCIRPLYYWAGIQKDYARYDKLDYFNPIFNEVGYETIPRFTFGGSGLVDGSISAAKQPCYNEFRSSYDRVLGDMALIPGKEYKSFPVLSSWVQQRVNPIVEEDGLSDFSNYLNGLYFTDVNQANSVFASTAEDNFFVNLYYNVTSKSLVSKNFATNLAIR